MMIQKAGMFELPFGNTDNDVSKQIHNLGSFSTSLLTSAEG